MPGSASRANKSVHWAQADTSQLSGSASAGPSTPYKSSSSSASPSASSYYNTGGSPSQQLVPQQQQQHTQPSSWGSSAAPPLRSVQGSSAGVPLSSTPQRQSVSASASAPAPSPSAYYTASTGTSLARPAKLQPASPLKVAVGSQPTGAAAASASAPQSSPAKSPVKATPPPPPSPQSFGPVYTRATLKSRMKWNAAALVALGLAGRLDLTKRMWW